MPTIAEEALDTLAGVNLDAIFVYHPEFEGNYIRSKGIKPKEIHPNLKFTYASFLASDARRKIIEDVWGVPYRNGAGGGDQYITGAECIYSAPAHGAHMMEDRLIIEVLDPNTWEPVAPGNYGELVVTNLWAEASPYIRYRTEDIVVADYTPCPCGNTHVKLRFLGRMPWSVDVQGHRIFTDDVENVTWRYSETEFAPYQLVRYKEQPQKELILRVVYRHKTEKSEEDVREMLTRALEKEFAVPCKVELVSPEEIAVGFVKFQRIVEVPGKQP
jgi:phenylacetate-CoA ligase